MINLFLARFDPIFIDLGGLQISWYAVFILTGALIAYAISRHLFKKEGYNPEILDNLFIICFPMGIIGARLWFVLSNLSDYDTIWEMFAIWNGGLAIQGGVVLGALSGIIYLRHWHKEIPLLHAFDMIIPNILIAQSLGRWGNFMNQEVFGACVPRSSLPFIPSFILDQMEVPACKVGEVAQPLFLYESLLTLTAFILISVVLRKFWKNRKLGTLGALYFIAYGIIRGPLELLRDPEYIMMMFGMPTSVMTSIVFVLIGVGFLVYIYLIKDKIKNKEIKKENEK